MTSDERQGDAGDAGAAHAAFARTTEDFHELLTGLGADEWDAYAHTDHGTVHGVVAHLVGIERLSLAWLDPDAPPPVDPATDHVAATRAVVEELAHTEPAALAREWYQSARAVAAKAATGDPERPVAFHDLTTNVAGLLVTRTFELWAHGMDIALATGHAAPALDPARMMLLSSQLMAALPLALAYRGQSAPGRSARFVLTGAAGGTYTIALDPTRPAPFQDPPDVTIVADAVELCRVAARRLPASELETAVHGDEELAGLLLGAADAFARD